MCLASYLLLSISVMYKAMANCNQLAIMTKIMYYRDTIDIVMLNL